MSIRPPLDGVEIAPQPPAVAGVDPLDGGAVPDAFRDLFHVAVDLGAEQVLPEHLSDHADGDEVGDDLRTELRHEHAVHRQRADVAVIEVVIPIYGHVDLPFSTTFWRSWWNLSDRRYNRINREESQFYFSQVVKHEDAPAMSHGSVLERTNGADCWGRGAGLWAGCSALGGVAAGLQGHDAGVFTGVPVDTDGHALCVVVEQGLHVLEGLAHDQALSRQLVVPADQHVAIRHRREGSGPVGHVDVDRVKTRRCDRGVLSYELEQSSHLSGESFRIAERPSGLDDRYIIE